MENTQKNYGEMCNVTKIKLELETRYTHTSILKIDPDTMKAIW